MIMLTASSTSIMSLVRPVSSKHELDHALAEEDVTLAQVDEFSDTQLTKLANTSHGCIAGFQGEPYRFWSRQKFERVIWEQGMLPEGQMVLVRHDDDN